MTTQTQRLPISVAVAVAGCSLLAAVASFVRCTCSLAASSSLRRRCRCRCRLHRRLAGLALGLAQVLGTLLGLQPAPTVRLVLFSCDFFYIFWRNKCNY